MTIPRGKPGVTLVELVVALTLFSVVATIMLTMLRGQQRFHAGSLEIIDTKRSIQQAAALLYGELRAASSATMPSARRGESEAARKRRRFHLRPQAKQGV